MSEVKRVFFGLRLETSVMAAMLFDKAVNLYSSMVKENFTVRKPVIFDGKRVTMTDGDTVASHIMVTTSGKDKEMTGSVYVDPSDQRIVLDARRFENYPGEYGVGPFRKAAMSFRDKEALQKLMRAPSPRPGSKDSYPDLEVH